MLKNLGSIIFNLIFIISVCFLTSCKTNSVKSEVLINSAWQTCDEKEGYVELYFNDSIFAWCPSFKPDGYIFEFKQEKNKLILLGSEGKKLSYSIEVISYDSLKILNYENNETSFLIRLHNNAYNFRNEQQSEEYITKYSLRSRQLGCKKLIEENKKSLGDFEFSEED